jgi:hypothetical protein
VLYAVTKVNSVDVRLLCSCTVCSRMSFLSVACVCVCVCVRVRAPGVPVLVKSGHRALLMGPLKMVVNMDRNM